MKLRKVHITNFRCIEDSTEFSIENVTCLVGKNESGKTTVLQALEALHPQQASRERYEKLRDYPRRHLADFTERHPDGRAKAIVSKWDLEPEDKAVLAKAFGPASVLDKQLEVSKFYENEGTTWSVPLDPASALKHVVSQAIVDETERGELLKLRTSQAIHAHLSAIPTRTEHQNALLAVITKFRKHDLELAAIDALSPQMPKFLYFSQYDKMSGMVSVDKLRNDQANNKLDPGDRVFLAFLDFAATSLEDLTSSKKYEDLKARVEAASNKITDQIFDYWSQNQHLAIDFELAAGQVNDPAPFNQGLVMHARVKNHVHKMTVPFSDRSAGFVWFFSFLVLFAHVRKSQGRLIILLDEPGLNLHGKAQGDLLRYIKEKLEPHHQVIYTTHSPFMVPADNLMSVRTVEDVLVQKSVGRYQSEGTKVGDKVLSTDADTLFPLQAALGYDITQTLFVGKDTLLVEGPSDVLYIQAASAALKTRGRTGLDARWTVCPSGGLDKVTSFVSLFSGNKLHIAVLTDIAKGQKGKIDSLRKSNLLKSGHIFTVGDFTGQEEADVEDLFTPNSYVAIVNAAFDLQSPHKLTESLLANADKSTTRMVKKAEAYFRTLPPTVKEFDHFLPAHWLIQNPKHLAGAGAKADPLDGFEKAFVALNALLS